MKVELRELESNVYFLKFDNQYELTVTMLRFQEFYESAYPNIQYKYFTLEDYMDTYAADQGNFTYCSDWNGFNIPSKSLMSFLEVYRGKLRDKEIQVIELLTDAILSGEKFYVIAGCEDKVIVHEMAHALYYVNEEYRENMDTLLASLPKELMKRFTDALTEVTYSPLVHMDEVQAYCVDNFYMKENQLPNMKLKKADEKYFEQFYSLFREYYENN